MNCGGSIAVMQPDPQDESGSTPTPPLQKRDWIVAGCPIEVAEHLVKHHHYAKGASNTATYLHGLYPQNWHWYHECVGVAWWIPPTKSAAQKIAGGDWQGVLSLSRLVIEPDAPKNAASFLLSKSMRMIDRNRWPVLVTYADEWRGHTGAIYRASGWQYDGLTEAHATYTLAGKMIARKRGNLTRTHQQMIAMGAQMEGRFKKHRFIHRQDARK